MISHKAEFVVDIPRAKLLQILTDPVYAIAMLGHFSNLHPRDSTSYDVMFTMSVKGKKVVMEGIMRSPEYYISRVGYNGSTVDGRVRWSFAFELREKEDNSTVVRMHSSIDVRSNFFLKLSGLSNALADMPRHIVEEHVKPYLMKLSESYSPQLSVEVQPKVVFSEEGELTQLFGKALIIAKGMGTALVLIDAGKLSGAVVFKDSRVERVSLLRGFIEERVNDVNALVSLLSEGKGKVTVYTFDVEELVKKAMNSLLKPGGLVQPSPPSSSSST